MVTRYFHTTAANINKVKKRSFLSLYIHVITFISFLTFLVSSISGYSQAQVNNPRYGTRTETITRADIKFLPENRRPLSAQYEQSISNTNKELFDKRLIPFYPYFDINLDSKFLPPAPFRIYLGKRSKQENSKDYVLVIVQCIKRRADTTKYADSAISSMKGAKVSPVWYSVEVGAAPNQKDRITYSEVTNKQARDFVKNFKTFLRSQRLTDRYPTCIIFRGRSARDENYSNRLKLQPVVWVTPPKKPRDTGGSKSVHGIKAWKFLDKYTLEDADSRTGTCCEAPPENGNSIEN